MAYLRVTLRKNQFHNLKFSQKGILHFRVTTATVGLCMKEAIDIACSVEYFEGKLWTH